VTEKRAPTDQSVALLKEMEEAARKKVIETIVVADTSFECKIHKVFDVMSDQDMYAITYKMNGLQRNLTVRIDRFKNFTPVEVACIIRDKVAVDIANEMIATAFSSISS
jgi:negative regulator of sigma E activity